MTPMSGGNDATFRRYQYVVSPFPFRAPLSVSFVTQAHTKYVHIRIVK